MIRKTKNPEWMGRSGAFLETAEGVGAIGFY